MQIFNCNVNENYLAVILSIFLFISVLFIAFQEHRTSRILEHIDKITDVEVGNAVSGTDIIRHVLVEHNAQAKNILNEVVSGSTSVGNTRNFEKLKEISEKIEQIEYQIDDIEQMVEKTYEVVLRPEKQVMPTTVEMCLGDVTELEWYLYPALKEGDFLFFNDAQFKADLRALNKEYNLKTEEDIENLYFEIRVNWYNKYNKLLDKVVKGDYNTVKVGY